MKGSVGERGPWARFARARSTALLAVALAMPAAHPVHALDWEWRNPLPQGNALTCVAGGDGQFLAVGDGATVLHATEGGDWQRLPNNLYPDAICHSLLYVDGVWLLSVEAPFDQAALWRSADGREWQRAGDGDSRKFYDLTVQDGHYVGAGWTMILVDIDDRGTRHETQGGFVATSGNGVDWTTIHEGERIMRSVAYGNGSYATVSTDGSLWVSSDANAWQPVEGVVGERLHDVAYGDGRFVAVGRNGSVALSEDGRSWEAAESGSAGDFFKVAHGDGRFVAVTGAGEALESPDGRTWQRSAAGGIGSLDLAFDGARFGAVGDVSIHTRTPDGEWHAHISKASGADGPPLRLSAAVYGAQGFVAVGQDGGVLVSEDAARWSRRSGGTGAMLRGVAYGDGAYVAVGEGGVAARSVDGASWQASNIAAEDLYAVAHGAQGFVAVGVSGTIVQSPDGLSWTARASGVDAPLRDVAFGPHGYVAVGSGNNSTILHSVDGELWEERRPSGLGDRTLAHLAHLAHLAYGNERYLAIFVDVNAVSDVLVSENGRHWTPHATGLEWVQALGFDPTRAQFVASALQDEGLHTVFVSDGEEEWQRGRVPASKPFNGFAAAGGALIAVGQNEAILQAGAFSAPSVVPGNGGDDPNVGDDTADEGTNGNGAIRAGGGGGGGCSVAPQGGTADTLLLFLLAGALAHVMRRRRYTFMC